MPESNPWSDAIPASPPVAPPEPAPTTEAPGLTRELLSELEGDAPAGPRPRVTNTATYVLLTLVVLLATFSAGAWVGRNRAPSTSRTTSAATAGPGGVATGGFTGAGGFSGAGGGRGAAAAGGASGATGAPGAGAAGAGAAGAGGGFAGGNLTTGTVKLVDGPNVYLSTATGTVVKVTTNAQSQITVTKQGSLTDLAAGETLIVQGEAGADGTIVATSIRSGNAGGAGGAGAIGGRGNGPAGGQGGGAATPTTTAGGR